MVDSASQSWIPLKAALVWVASEDSEELEAFFARSESISNKLDVDDGYWDDAWQALRELIASGRVLARGVPFRRPAPSAAAREVAPTPKFEPGPDDTEEDETSDPVEVALISPMDVLHLELDTRRMDPVLRHKARALIGSTEWHHVEISKAGLVEMVGELPKEARSVKEHSIIRVWREVVPDGQDSVLSVGDQNGLIRAELKRRGSKRFPSDNTIRAVLRAAGIRRGRS